MAISLNTIYNENCLETMARMPDCFVDLTVTSPPYDDMRDYKGYSFPFEEIAKELHRITKEGGIIVWVVGDTKINGSESLSAFKQAIYFNELGLRVHDTMIYEKAGSSLPHDNIYNQAFEYMFVISKGKPKTTNLIADRKNTYYTGKPKYRTVREKDGKTYPRNSIQGAKSVRSNIWRYSAGYMLSTSDDVWEHPAVFPEKLAADHIWSWSNEGDLVYDCFGGSGTTAKMAHRYKRKWILSEISKEYCEIARKRLEPYLNQTVLF